jgi:hypothetical protein
MMMASASPAAFRADHPRETRYYAGQVKASRGSIEESQTENQRRISEKRDAARSRGAELAEGRSGEFFRKSRERWG